MLATSLFFVILRNSFRKTFLQKKLINEYRQNKKYGKNTTFCMSHVVLVKNLQILHIAINMK